MSATRVLRMTGHAGPVPAGKGCRWLAAGTEHGLWAPQVEIFERDGELVVRADLPGLTKDDVNVEIDNDAITIEGERHSEAEEYREGFYRTERTYGKFYRRVPLPDGLDAENADATFSNGVLEVTMPAAKRGERKTRRLEINAAANGRDPSLFAKRRSLRPDTERRDGVGSDAGAGPPIPHSQHTGRHACAEWQTYRPRISYRALGDRVAGGSGSTGASRPRSRSLCCGSE